MNSLAFWGPVYVLLWLVTVRVRPLRNLPTTAPWLLAIGDFFSGGAWLTFILVPFTTGICVIIGAVARGANGARGSS